MTVKSVATVFTVSLGIGLALNVAAQDQPQAPRVDTPKAFAAVVGDAKPIGDGPLVAYRTKDQTLLAFPTPLLDRLFFWYVEAARFPPNAIAKDGNSVAEAVVTLERQGSRLLVQDRSPSFEKRSPSGIPEGDPSTVDPRRTSAPIDVAIDAAALGPVIAALPIVAEADGRILVDLTTTFSNDIDGLTAAAHIASAGVVPAPIGLTVDTARSYIADIGVYPDNLHVRSHLTFRAQNPQAPVNGFQPISIELGHSLVMLPEKAMAARRYDDRVGFNFTSFAEFESASGELATDPLRGIIKRFRLEKADPSAPVSDPVKPIVFYIGRGVPDRWRPYIAAGIESWQPAFEAAGFSNAILARNAPTPAENPGWSPEDARYNVIRWVPQPFTNAMGPSVADPRSGEILFAHILVWPQVIDWIQDYYWLMGRGLDPAVDRLPLREEKQGELLKYVVAHEVGHSIGLRHNHLASTAYTVAELRDPQFANAHGPNASIMAYRPAEPGRPARRRRDTHRQRPGALRLLRDQLGLRPPRDHARRGAGRARPPGRGVAQRPTDAMGGRRGGIRGPLDDRSASADGERRRGAPRGHAPGPEESRDVGGGARRRGGRRQGVPPSVHPRVGDLRQHDEQRDEGGRRAAGRWG